MKRFEFPVQMLRYTEDANDGVWTDKSHYLILYAMTHLVRPENAIEIGSRRGGSAMWIAKAMEEIGFGKLYCIDPFIAAHGGAPGFLAHFAHNLEELGLDNRVELLEMRSDDPDVSPILPDEIELLFIDGDHSYQGAKEDLERYVPHVKSGGCVMIHDSLCEVGVKAAIETSQELLSPYVHFTMENRNGMWIGVKI
jgi:predicted O-methyltransferase YrrM